MENIDLLKRTLLKYKNLLCNLTRRNKELFYRETSSSLSLSKLTMSQETKDKEKYIKEFNPLRLNSPDLAKLISEKKLSLTDLFKLDHYENLTLIKKIDKIRQNDNKYQKEFGISGGWLLGPFLIWKNKDQKEIDEIIISPIFKLPIDIEKTKGKNFDLVLEENDLYINPTLKLYLEREFGIILPESLVEDTIEKALEKIIWLIKEKTISIALNSNYDELVRIPPRHKIIRDENGDVVRREKVDINEYLNETELEFYKDTSSQNFIIHDLFYVDHINASKMALHNDYDEIMENLDHPLINELLLGSKIPEKTDKSKIKELDKYCEKENYFVVDIDSSQHLALDAANSERAIVIQGPPGTGKSQTITNLISQLLADNKKILFISEKRAALDVVYQRLKKSELDKQSVIIHSSDLDRKELYTSFIETLNESYDPKVEDQWSVIGRELDYYKKKVSDYVESLKVVDPRSGLDVVDLFTLYSQHLSKDLDISVADYFQFLNFKRIKELIVNISELNILIDKIPNYKDNIWLNKKSSFLITERSSIELKNAINSMKNLLGEINDLNLKNKDLFPNGNSTSKLLDISSLKGESNEIPLKILQKFRGLQNDLERFSNSFNTSLEEMSSNYINFSKFSERSDFESMKELSSYYSTPKGVLDWFSLKYWKMRKMVKFFLKDKKYKLNLNDEIKSWITFSTNFHNTVEMFSEISIPKSYFENIDESFFGKISNEIESSKTLVTNLNNIGGDRSIADYNESSYLNLVKDQKILFENKKRVAELEREISSLRQYFFDLTNFEELRVQDSNEGLIYLIDKLWQDSIFINDIENVNRKYLEIEDRFKLVGLKKFFLKNLLEIENVEDYIVAQVVKGWYESLIKSAPYLQKFNSELHAEYLSKYLEYIDKHQELARVTVNNNLAKAKESSGSISKTGLRILHKEANKQRRIKPPREIMEAGALETMISMKRCWLMSPLSISQIMPNVSGLFDVVIFDEASQVRVEDAIPSIYRGKSLIVVGDNKQMPPTNFFSGGSGDGDFDDEEEIELGESVLDQALKSYPDVLLEWHYRSQEEALIAFSNYAFYGGRLIAPPNPSTLVKGKPIVFETVKDGIFSSKNGNIIEAKAIVKEVVDILTHNPGASVGVISMGVSQQRIIEKLLDDEAQLNKKFAESYEKAMSYTEDGAFVGFFNKNLENVQGDERDYIIISIGYAPSKVGGKLRQAFGPLSSKGGGRRLNVAITRAKKRIKVYCSFDPRELTISEEAFSKNPDKTYFSRYINFAKAVSEERLEEAQNILKSFPVTGIATQRKPSRFNRDVKKEIEKLGYKVDTEIGSCGFYVDLGVEHPQIENSYVLGIECDGAIFHSSDYARDRDRARQALLEARGWKIHRIWSQDWSKHREKEIEKIRNILENLDIKQSIESISTLSSTKEQILET